MRSDGQMLLHQVALGAGSPMDRHTSFFSRAEEMRNLLDSIETGTRLGLRERAARTVGRDRNIRKTFLGISGMLLLQNAGFSKQATQARLWLGRTIQGSHKSVPLLRA